MEKELLYNIGTEETKLAVPKSGRKEYNKVASAENSGDYIGEAQRMIQGLVGRGKISKKEFEVIARGLGHRKADDMNENMSDEAKAEITAEISENGMFPLDQPLFGFQKNAGKEAADAYMATLSNITEIIKEKGVNIFLNLVRAKKIHPTVANQLLSEVFLGKIHLTKQDSDQLKEALRGNDIWQTEPPVEEYAKAA